MNPCLAPNRSSISRGETEPSGCQDWNINLLSTLVALIEAASGLCRVGKKPLCQFHCLQILGMAMLLAEV